MRRFIAAIASGCCGVALAGAGPTSPVQGANPNPGRATLTGTLRHILPSDVVNDLAASDWVIDKGAVGVRPVNVSNVPGQANHFLGRRVIVTGHVLTISGSGSLRAFVVETIHTAP